MADEGRKAYLVLKETIENMKDDLDTILEYAKKRLIEED